MPIETLKRTYTKYLMTFFSKNEEYVPLENRTRELEYSVIPASTEQFRSIVSSAPIDILIGMGFELWDTCDELSVDPIALGIDDDLSNYGIFLFPFEWYSIIPEKYQIVDLSGQIVIFSNTIHSNERRFGCLAYGIVRKLN